MLRFVHAPILGTLEDHKLFSCPFIAGCSLSPVPEASIRSFRGLAKASDWSEEQAIDYLVGLVEAGTADLQSIRDELHADVKALRLLVTDAARLASCPTSPADDAAVIGSYLDQVRGIIARPLPAGDVLRHADQVARWIARFEGDQAKLSAAVLDHEKMQSSIAHVRTGAKKIEAELQQHLQAVQSDKTRAKVFAVKIERDFGRVLPQISESLDAAQHAHRLAGEHLAAALKAFTILKGEPSHA